MAKVDNKGANTQSMMMHRMKHKAESPGKIEEFDLGATDVILFGSSVCLNAADPKKLPLVIRPNPENNTLISDPDVDEQIMIKLSFRDPVSLTNLIIRADVPPPEYSENENNTSSEEKSKEKNTNTNTRSDDESDEEKVASAPRMLKLFANKPELDFTDAEDRPASQQLVLSKEQCMNGSKVLLKSLKFQRVSSLQIFVVDNQDSTDVTFMNRVGLIGRLAKAYHTDYGT